MLPSMIWQSGVDQDGDTLERAINLNSAFLFIWPLK
jgi:hypothetical protein